MNDAAVTWLITRMGYGSSLLYWEPLLRGYCQHFPNTRILTSERKKLTGLGGLAVEEAVKFHRLFSRKHEGSYETSLIVVSPRPIITLLRRPPELLILSEFGLLTIYGVLATLLRPRIRVLLLVESAPGRLAGNRTRRLRARVRRLVCRRAAQILTNNSDGERYLMNDLGVPSAKIRRGAYLVSSPPTASVPTTDMPDARLAHSRDEYIAFLFVGQLTERKAVLDLLAATQLLEPVVQRRIKVWIVGGGDQADQLEEEIRTSGLQDLFCLFGIRPYQSLRHFYANADVFVIPTHHDYRALVGFEALAFGLPIIHSRGDGAAVEVVDEGRNGFTFPPGDVRAISGHMRWFVDNEHRIAEFRARSTELSSRYTVAGAVDVLVDASRLALAR